MVQRPLDETVLDNPVWHALHGPSSRFVAFGATSDFIYFDPEISVFGAVERIDEDTWRNVAEVIGLRGECGFFRDVIPSLPGGWEEHFRGACLQMVARDLLVPDGMDVVRLGPEDVPDMLALTELTEPGPFLDRTFELGRYVGIRRDGRLVGMAGERFRLPGFVEISAVCTHPDVRGQGLARELTLNVAHSIRALGDQAFLHVLEENEPALRLYEKIGFDIRRRVDVVFAQWHGGDWQPDPTAMSNTPISIVRESVARRSRR